MKKMKYTTIYKKLDIVLVPFPFTDLSAAKKRPALIVSPDEYNAGLDVVITFITSKLDLRYKVGDYKLTLWKESGLPKPSMVRMKFATIDKSVIIKKLGRLAGEDIEKFGDALSDFFRR